ncbi:MAG TPA: response regulator [Planctomycetota bacterium]|nr:response regulator [Planctomycetota bacterium]
MVTDSTKPTLLFVDDDESLRYAIDRAFALDGRYNLITDDSVDSALKLAETTHFNLAILDIRLVGRTGAELAWRLRQLHPTLPIIALSADLSNWDKDDLKDIGFTEIVEKPIDFPDFLALIARHLAATAA